MEGGKLKRLLEHILTGNWRIISSYAPPEVAAVDDPGNAGWRERHCDLHRDVELVLALSGRTVCRLNDACYPLLPGDWMVFSTGDRHDCGYTPDSPEALHCWVHLQPELLHWCSMRIAPGGHTTLVELYLSDDSLFCTWLWHEMILLGRSDAEAMEKTRHLRSILGCLAARMLTSIRRADALHSVDARIQIVGIIERRIIDSCGRGMTVEKAARLAGYSPYHFMRLFKRVTGKTLNDYISEVRFRRCCSEMARGAKLKEIAPLLGFSSPAALSHWLKKRKAQE